MEWIIPLRFLLLNVAMVPSSMKVTLELIKILYTVFIHQDEHLYVMMMNDDDSSCSRNSSSSLTSGEASYVHCNSTSLCETLGSVRYILNDKTGTLTKNELRLRELWVADQKIDIVMTDDMNKEKEKEKNEKNEKNENGPSHLAAAMETSVYGINREEVTKKARQVILPDNLVSDDDDRQ